jgi:hypothetical protein
MPRHKATVWCGTGSRVRAARRISSPDLQVPLVLPAHPARPVRPASPDLLGLQVPQVRQDHLALQVRVVPPVLSDPVVVPADLVRAAISTSRR